MRVLVVSDRVAELDPLAAGTAVARGWAEDAQVAMVPLAAGGADFAAALGQLSGGGRVLGDEGWLVEAPGLLGVGVAPGGTDARALGAWLAECLAARPVPERLILDLSGRDVRDLGAGLLQGWGIDRPAARERLAGTVLEAVVPTEEVDLTLLGLRGVIAEQGFADRLDVAGRLAAESAMQERLTAAGLSDGPGAGAAGGAGALVLGLGGRLTSGIDLLIEQARLVPTIARADVVVVAASSFHIGNQGGEVVRRVAELAQQAMRPCLVLAGETEVSRREMRAIGIEAAHPLLAGPTAAALQATARRVAQGWSAGWGARVDSAVAGE